MLKKKKCRITSSHDTQNNRQRQKWATIVLPSPLLINQSGSSDWNKLYSHSARLFFDSRKMQINCEQVYKTKEKSTNTPPPPPGGGWGQCSWRMTTSIWCTETQSPDFWPCGLNLGLSCKTSFVLLDKAGPLPLRGQCRDILSPPMPHGYCLMESLFSIYWTTRI